MWSIEADGRIVIERNGQPLLIGQPFIAAYGVQLRAVSARQTAPNQWECTTLVGAVFSLTLAPSPSGGTLMFHVKPPLPQIGVRWQLQPGGPWYGLGERVIQGWPLESTGVRSLPLQSYDHSLDGTLNICTPLLIAASGVALLVSEDHGKLDVELPTQDPTGAITLTSHAPPIPFGAGFTEAVEPNPAQLTLQVIVAEDVRAATIAAIAQLGHPRQHPPLELCVDPIWTTWAHYKMPINQAKTLEFAHAIMAHEFPHSVLEIDDRWQSAYGDFDFDKQKFPDPAAMVAQLHQMGFKVTLWVPPFFHPASAGYAEAAAHGYLVTHPATGQPFLTRWWQGWGGLIDVSNPAALAWWKQQLDQLQLNYGIDGFKFDGGEGNFLPHEARTFSPITPNEYTDRYIDWVAQHWRWSEVRAGWRSQRHGILFREWDKASRWGLDNGLQAVITQALALSTIGYPFILPDMIGGNAYNGEVPDRELLIRWTQVCALMPAMQFSIPPWIYDAEAVAICRRYVELHRQLRDDLSSAFAEVIAAGTPIVRPLWWHAPADARTYAIADQWLFGARWLAAPVVNQGQTARDIYLPAGRWRDYWSQQEHVGPVQLSAYPAPLERLPLFEHSGD